MATRFQSAMAKLPLVAILRGVTPADAPLILEALLDEGFALIEIPLNSPNPLESLSAMRRKAPADVFIGAGTVLSAADVAAVADAGGDLVVTPNVEPGGDRRGQGARPDLPAGRRDADRGFRRAPRRRRRPEGLSRPR